MAPHADNQHTGNGGQLLPKQSITKSHNATAKPASPPFRGRDLQSAMQHAPTIRVIHIFAPKVIKTDVANFRSTVQKLTGRSKTKSQRRSRKEVSEVANNNNAAAATAPAVVSSSPAGGLFWDQQADKEVQTLQRMVGDACGMTASDHLMRCDSVDSATYSLDSGNTDSTSAGTSTSPGIDHGAFSFYPQRETPYSLGEIPAPFFGNPQADMMQTFNTVPAFGVPGNHNVLMGLPTSHFMDHQLFDEGLISPLPMFNSSSDGSLFDLTPRQHCRLSVQSPYQGANFFEPI